MGWTKKANGEKKTYKKKQPFMTKTLATKRYNQVSTKLYYFKGNGVIAADNAGNGVAGWTTRTRIVPPPPATPYFMPGIPADFYRVSRGFAQYKVLAIKLVLHPANVGTESDMPGINTSPWQRGNCITWIEQQLYTGQQIASNISDVMNLGSAKMFIPRQKHSRTVYRPKGLPAWGTCDADVPDNQWVLDPWWGGIFWMINRSTPNTLGQNALPLFYYQTTLKVVFRGRNKGPGGGVTGVENTDPVFLLENNPSLVA